MINVAHSLPSQASTGELPCTLFVVRPWLCLLASLKAVILPARLLRSLHTRKWLVRFKLNGRQHRFSFTQAAI